MSHAQVLFRMEDAAGQRPQIATQRGPWLGDQTVVRGGDDDAREDPSGTPLIIMSINNSLSVVENRCQSIEHAPVECDESRQDIPEAPQVRHHEEHQEEGFVLHRKLLRCRHAMKIRKMRQERIRLETLKRTVDARHVRNIELMVEACSITPPAKRVRTQGTTACP